MTDNTADSCVQPLLAFAYASFALYLTTARTSRYWEELWRGVLAAQIENELSNNERKDDA